MLRERERPSHFGVYRDAAFLSSCNPVEAVEWLKNRTVGYSSVFGTPETPSDSHVLEYILYRRNAPMIDLALAEHGRSGSVLARVYKRADSFTRVVACSNPSLFVGELRRFFTIPDDEPLVWRIVRRGPLAELRAICENPDLTSGFYEGLVSSWEGDENSKIATRDRLSSHRFKRVLLFLSRNSRISMPRELSKERHYLDGFSEYQYNRFFLKCWELARVVPVEEEWAYSLSRLYQKLHVPFDLFKDDIGAVLDRWRVPNEKQFASTVSIREEIAAKFIEPAVKTLNSNDAAIRHAFYRTFDPDSYPANKVDWSEWLARDEMCFIDLQRNEKIWRSWRGRAKLRSLLWKKSEKDHDITAVGFFDEQEQEYRHTNPEWFRDEESDFRERQNGKSLKTEPTPFVNGQALVGSQSSIVTRLGWALYWAGALLAALLIALVFVIAIFGTGAQDRLFQTVIIGVAVAAWLFGRACRYVLSGE